MTIERSKFHELEWQIVDLDRIGKIADLLAQQTHEGDDIEMLLFVIDRFATMAADLRKSYAACFELGKED